MMNSNTVESVKNRTYTQLALAAAIVTFLMIVIGAITRVSESGMGCGTYWPTCNGRIVPEFENTAVVIEFGHRLFAGVVGIATLALLVQAFRRHRDEPALLAPAVLGLILYIVQSGLGAITVKLNNEWLSVLLHLGNSMFLLACYIVAWVKSRRAELNQGRSSLTMPEILLTTILAFGVVLVGAAVAGNDATKACVGWPLCMGEVWPAAQGPLQMLNMAHRLIAGLLGILLLVMLFRARTGNNLALRNTLYAAVGLYLFQAAIGAAVVMVNNRDGLVVAQSLHVTLAAATWSVMVLASGILWLQQQSKQATSRPGERIQAPSATTSN